MGQKIAEETLKREEHLHSILAQIELLRNTEEIDAVRQKEIKEIRERAHQDKSEDEKEWRALLMTQYFLGSFLTDRMNK